MKKANICPQVLSPDQDLIEPLEVIVPLIHSFLFPSPNAPGMLIL